MRGLRIWGLALLGLIAGCQSPPQAAAPPATNRNIEKIAAVDSQISVIGSDVLIVQRARLNTLDRYAEAFELSPGGALVYQKSYAGGFALGVNGGLEEEFRTRFFIDNRLRLTPEHVARRTNSNGDYRYSVVETAAYKCVVFQQYLGSVVIGQPNNIREYVRGERCVARQSNLLASLEKDTFDLLDRLRFDEGFLNRVTGRPSRTAPPAIPAGELPFAVSWTGVAELMSGKMTVTGVEGGSLAAKWPGRGEISCDGAWKAGGMDAGGALVGTWSLRCQNGLAASGSFRSLRPWQGTGEGKDNEGRAVKVTYGE